MCSKRSKQTKIWGSTSIYMRIVTMMGSLFSASRLMETRLCHATRWWGFWAVGTQCMVGWSTNSCSDFGESLSFSTKFEMCVSYDPVIPPFILCHLYIAGEIKATVKLINGLRPWQWGQNSGSSASLQTGREVAMVTASDSTVLGGQGSLLSEWSNLTGCTLSLPPLPKEDTEEHDHIEGLVQLPPRWQLKC
jgi:hypothetical protein